MAVSYGPSDRRFRTDSRFFAGAGMGEAQIGRMSFELDGFVSRNSRYVSLTCGFSPARQGRGPNIGNVVCSAVNPNQIVGLNSSI